MNTVTPDKATPDELWDIIIKPRASLLQLNLKDVWRYRDLMLLFVRRDFVAQYKQTILGPIWYLLQPIITTIMFLIIFTRVARIPTDGIHPIVFYMSGITLWTYFSTCLTATSNTFVANANIFGKVYFPRLVTPISIVISNLIRFGIQFLLLLTTMIWFSFRGYPIELSLNWLFVPIILFVLAGLSLALGIIISSLTTKYRDFTILVTFGIQLLMYATPIVYPLSFLKDKGYGWVIEWNPISPLVEAFRYALLGKGTFTPQTILYSVGFATVALALGMVLFNRVEKTFMDTV
jgi:lipopolysaccharide transport system permease protein